LRDKCLAIDFSRGTIDESALHWRRAFCLARVDERERPDAPWQAEPRIGSEARSRPVLPLKRKDTALAKALKTTANPKAAGDIDALIGAKVRRFRKEAGISQTQLGQSSGITFQQVQKYENGTNRVSVSRLAQIAATLDVPLAAFFESLPDAADKRRKPAGVPIADRLVATTQGLRLAKAFLAIDDTGVRSKLVAVAEALSGRDGSDE
jgi:transcriptional regulator with XRE-family HTH domain